MLRRIASFFGLMFESNLGSSRLMNAYMLAGCVFGLVLGLIFLQKGFPVGGHFSGSVLAGRSIGFKVASILWIAVFATGSVICVRGLFAPRK